MPAARRYDSEFRFLHRSMILAVFQPLSKSHPINLFFCQSYERVLTVHTIINSDKEPLSN